MAEPEIQKGPLFERSPQRLILQQMFEEAHDLKQYDRVITYDECARAINEPMHKTKSLIGAVLASLQNDDKWFVNIRKQGYRPASAEDRVNLIAPDRTKHVRRASRKTTKALAFQGEDWDELDQDTKVKAQGYALVNHLVAKATASTNIKAATNLIEQSEVNRQAIEDMSLKKTMAFFQKQ